MNNSDAKKFNELFLTTCEIYAKKASDQVLRQYWRLLKAYDFKQVEDAFDRHQMDSKEGSFFPKPANILKFLNNGKSSLQIANEQAGRTWLLKKVEEFRTGTAAYSIDEVTRMKLGAV